MIDKILATENGDIFIVSGEGERGTVEAYNGERTEGAINARLKQERVGGDRWARARVKVGEGHYIDLETGEPHGQA